MVRRPAKPVTVTGEPVVRQRQVRRPKSPKREKRTAQNQTSVFKAPELEILEQIDIGDLKLRLVQTVGSKFKTIETWQSMSNRWSTMYQTKVDQAWESWKSYYANLHNEEQGDRRGADNDPKPGRKRSVSRKQPAVATDVDSAKVSTRNRTRPVKDERRVERPAEEHQKRVRKRKQD